MALVKKETELHLIGYKSSGKYYSPFSINTEVDYVQNDDGSEFMYTDSVKQAVLTEIELGELPPDLLYSLDTQKHPDEIPVLIL
jgi:hypothetical protein